MKTILHFISLLFILGCFANERSSVQERWETEQYLFDEYKDSIAVVSWNIRDFGQTKDDDEIRFIARTIKEADVVALQEVVAGHGGAQAVARLAAALNRTGSQWDYKVSNPTPSPSYKTERYAYLWKTSKLSMTRRPELWTTYKDVIYRSPFLAFMKLKKSGEAILLVNYHSRKYDEYPEEELEKLILLDQQFANERIIIAGDFNIEYHKDKNDILAQEDFYPSIKEQPTTIKNKRTSEGQYLNKAIDNIFFEDEDFDLGYAEPLDFIPEFQTLSDAKGISDHLPVYSRLLIGEK